MTDEQYSEVLDRLDMLQSYIQHLGDRLDIAMRMIRREKSPSFQPPSMQTRRSKLLEVITKPE